MIGRGTLLVLSLNLATLAVPGPAAADVIVNGNFATGDLTGWTASAVDKNGNPTPPGITAQATGSTHFADFNTGTYATGPFDSTLSQAFKLNPADPILHFDFSLPKLTPDHSGTGTGPFLDALTVSVDDGTGSKVLLIVDKTGATLDPFGTAPGSVSLGSPQSPLFGFGFSADLSSETGRTLTLSLDLSNADDGNQSRYDLANFSTGSISVSKVPEPRPLLLATVEVLLSLLFLKTGAVSCPIWKGLRGRRPPEQNRTPSDL